MKRRIVRARVSLLVLVLAALVVLGVALIGGPPQRGLAGSAPAPQPQKPDNSACLACHSKPGQSYQLPSGEVLSISVDPAVYDKSSHANVACQVCHTNIAGFPHPLNAAQDTRAYTFQYKDTCKQCHNDQFKQLSDSVHTQLLNGGNRNAPVCSDCHNPHSQPTIQTDANGNPASVEHAAIAKICSHCHNDIYNQYVNSVHGSGIAENKNPDVPACTDCHGVHIIQGPDSPGFRINSPTQVCGKCHTNPQIMDKYGISTQVLNTYVADFHGTTVTLFEKTDPQAATNKPVCYDCHGVHNIARVDDPTQGIALKQNMLKACQRCHPDATTNFPDAWLSHYIPSPQKYPVVYIVNLFYSILIPTVIGGMVIYVGSDIYRRNFLDRRLRKGKKQDEPEKPPVDPEAKG
ncbi:MAG TPA: hypothetical protein VMS73_03245 [Anaerolineaceae bacterium]|nr:hypothetical protein [Anaerolineaceae bacterium]